MLIIKNIENIKKKAFDWEGKQWILHGVNVNNIEYGFVFIPKTTILDVYVIQNAQLVLLDRIKKRIGREVLGYRLWTTDGKHTYVNAQDIPNWTSLVKMVYKNRMIC
jgi:hypothetical protein